MDVTRDSHPDLPFHVTHEVEVGAKRTVARFAELRDAETYTRRSDLLGQAMTFDEPQVRAEVQRRLQEELARRDELKALIVRQETENAAAIAEGVRAELEKFFALPIAEIERQVICAAVTRCGNREDAAKSLGLGVRTIAYKLRSYGWAPHQKAG